MLNDRSNQATVSVPILSQILNSLLQVPRYHSPLFFQQRMSSFIWSVLKIQTICLQRNRPHKGRSHCHRMDCRTYIMLKSRQRKFLCTHTTPNRIRTFYYHCGKSLLLQSDGSSKTIGTRTYYDGIVFFQG